MQNAGALGVRIFRRGVGRREARSRRASDDTEPEGGAGGMSPRKQQRRKALPL